MASTIWAFSVPFLSQAPSCWVDSAKEVAPTSAVASEFGLNRYPTPTDTSSLPLSAGREVMNMNDGLRGRLGGVVSEDEGFAIAKQTFFPPGEGVQAPQSPYWPSSVG